VEPGDSLKSNPARVLVVRAFVLGVGGLLIYAALPNPFDSATWWQQTAHEPFIAGVLVALGGVLAPTRWLESLIVAI